MAARDKKAPDLNTLIFETLLLEFKAGIATVTLNRSKALNAMSVTMREELGACFEQLRYDKRVRAVVITGAGKAFCVGGDVNDVGAKYVHNLHDFASGRCRSLHLYESELARDYALVGHVPYLGHIYELLQLLPDLLHVAGAAVHHDGHS